MKAVPVVLLLALMPFMALASFGDPIANEDYVPGQVAVAVVPGGIERPEELSTLLRTVRTAEIASVEFLFGALEHMDSTARGLGLGRFFLVTVADGADHTGILDDLSRLPGVESVDLNWRFGLQWTPNDSLFTEQWSLQNTGQQPDYVPDIDMNAAEAWDITRGENAIVIAILDSGINYNHEDLSGQIWSNADEILDGEDTDGNGYVDDVMGWDFVNTTDPECQDPDCLVADNDPMDGCGHGTWISGIASATTDNGLGVAGVCPECRLMPCRAFYGDGAAGSCEMLRVIQAAYYAVANGADVLNMSFGNALSADSCSSSPTFDAVLDYAHAAGVVVVAGAGNESDDRYTYPACYPTVIGVASHDPDGAKSITSNYGNWVDVAAPGANCQTTSLDDGAYGTRSGTSIASPQVAGLAGLILSADPDITPDEVRDVIMSSSIPVDWPTTPIAAGRVNAYNALVGTGVEAHDAALLVARLHGNYPNPFNPGTTIEYELLSPARVTLRVYDLSGRLVRDLVRNETQSAGVHRVLWNGRDEEGRGVATGVYFYRCEGNGTPVQRKMMLLK